MQVQWLSVASLVIAFGAMFYSRRSSRTGLRSLDVTSAVGQVNYENARASDSPAATLELTEVEYRVATARELESIVGAEARKWASDYEADHLEVVARGRLVNNCPYELLLSLRDHPNSGRSTLCGYRNQSVFLLDSIEVKYGWAILPGGAEVSFEWIDRRSPDEWIALHELDNPADGTSSPLLAPVSWRNYLRATVDLNARIDLRRTKIARSGFYVVCESRATERVATIWHAAVAATPVTITGRDSRTDRLQYEENLRLIPGPIDDDTIRYRVTFDAVLAQLHTPRWRRLRGRS
ncbi:MAG: hypothetical protein M3443_13650 [Actinomycetota bacterium]|nr:hypothetical protein [Actinomycetota bacterium]